jgi:biopolymer transport protein ExbD
MKLESTLDSRPALLHLAPLLDVMALMVVFYLLGSNVIHHSGVGVELPVAAAQLPPLAASHVVLVSASATPLVLFDRELMTYDALIGRLGKRAEGSPDAIYFKMDRRLSLGTTMEIFNAALMGGYRVYQATEPEKTLSPSLVIPPSLPPEENP